jgi:hypothetical protein
MLRKSGVVHSFEVVDPVLFVFGSHVCIPDIFSSFLMTSLHILSSLVYPLTLLRKRISAASRQVITLTLHDYNFGLNILATECVRRMW